MNTHIDLFSGIGGFSLAAHWAGFKTVVFCEKDEFCQKVLKERFGGFVANSSINGLNETAKPRGTQEVKGSGGDMESKGLSDTPTGIPIIPDIRDFDGTRWMGATILTGGFPCQPFSAAGKRRGTEDDRHLWPEMLRVISEAKPRWVVGENVAGIINMELDTVLADLEGEGYEVGTVVIPACAKNAPHRRDRVWIIAQDSRCEHGKGKEESREYARKVCSEGATSMPERPIENGGIGDDSHATGKGLEGSAGQGVQGRSRRSTESGWQIPWLEVATSFCRVDDGLPPWIHRHRVKRLKALGNSIVPQIAYEIIRYIQ